MMSIKIMMEINFRSGKIAADNRTEAVPVGLIVGVVIIQTLGDETILYGYIFSIICIR